MKTSIIKYCLVSIALISTISANAQVRGGIVAGAITGPVRISNIDNRFSDVINGDNIYGFEGGFFFKPQLGPLYIKPEALYSYRSGRINYTNEASSVNFNFSVHKFQIPMLFGLNLPGPFFIEGGPVYNHIIEATNSFSENQLEISKNGLGYRLGAGADLGPLMLTVSYGGTTNRKGSNTIAYREPYMVVFGLGLSFGK